MFDFLDINGDGKFDVIDLFILDQIVATEEEQKADEFNPDIDD